MADFFTDGAGMILDGAGRPFDTERHAWGTESGLRAVSPISPRDAVRLALSQGARRLPVGLIGPNDASVEELALAEAAGAAIAGLGLPMICGGRGGCMEAASRGCALAGGLVIGVLPSGDWTTANAHVAIPIASGLGEARNAIIASACLALIAVGGGHGTLSEMALGLKMGRLVAAMPPAVRVPGALDCGTIEEAIEAIALRYLGASA